MATSQQRRIEKILGETEPDKDRSLRGQALRRASEEEVPRTLTAWEWEEWYEEHGVPAAHRNGQEFAPVGDRRFGRLLDWLSALKHKFQR